MPASLPTVVVPVFNSVAGLDACLASLERTLPAGSAVLIADDASSDPHVGPLARGWCYRSKLAARYLRRDTQLGLAANLSAAIAETGDSDVVLLKPEAVTTPGWLHQLARAAVESARSATLATWSNQSELCSFPRFGESNLPPEFPEPIADAAVGLAGVDGPELPAVSGPCLFLRRVALRQLGGLDSASFSGSHALDDFCRRAAAMGWSNLLCPAVFVVALPPAAPSLDASDDLPRLLARWPDYQELVARFILSDPLRDLRERLQTRIDDLARSGPQRDLFN